jgi:cysteine desulfurase/selenocysteine lyase
MPVDVQEMGIDFFAFSIHKMLGPSGMGGLWGREELLNSMRTIQSGGQTVKTSHYDAIEWAKSPSKFEGGLGHFAGMMATGAAIDYLSTLNMNDVHEHEVRLNTIMSNGVKDLEGVSIIGPEDPSKRGGICSLLLDDKLPVHDIALLLDEVSGVMVRSGQHCVHSWFNSKGYNGSLRASAYFYNTEEDVRRFVDTFSEAVQAFQ